MVFVDFLFVLVITLVVTSLFAIGFHRGGPWSSVAMFFLALFFGTWGIGAWLPFGPTIFGAYWLAYLCIAIALAAAIGWALPRRPGGLPRSGSREREPSTTELAAEGPEEGPRKRGEMEKERSALALTASTYFFLGGVVVALLAIVAHYALTGLDAPPHAMEQARPESRSTLGP
ncbi:MAG: hypothetical protein KJZ87_26330 [Thermoguttaceae bacterium]|nr:hypothetical protein [Thermoguttaceae bacterium]